MIKVLRFLAICTIGVAFATSSIAWAQFVVGVVGSAFGQQEASHLLRKIKDGERPRPRSQALLQARAEAEATYLGTEAKKKSPQKALPKLSMKDALQAELKRGNTAMPSTWKEYKQVHDRLIGQWIVDTNFYKTYQQVVQAHQINWPDIDSFSPYEVHPGGWLTIAGVNFGPSQGKVLLEIKPDYAVELRVDKWTDTLVTGYLDPLIGDVPLRPYYGRLWLITGVGTPSNAFPIMYRPIYWLVWLNYDQSVGSCCWGDTADGPALSGVFIGDPDFYLVGASPGHWGDGHGELTSPMAAGQSLEQGYHIGCRGHCSGGLTITYQVCGPKGILPPTPSDDHVTGWFIIGDYCY